MFKFKFSETHLITFFIAYFFISKLYLLYFNPINIGSNVIALNTQIFYNAKSFEFLPQSFHDWNHPGTPLYYYTNIVSLLITLTSVPLLKIGSLKNETLIESM